MNLLNLFTNPFKKKVKPIDTIESPLLKDPKEFDERVGEIVKGLDGSIERKLNEDQKIFIVKLIAYGWSANEILSQLKETYQVKLSTTALSHYRYSPKWKPLIKKLRDEYVANTMDVAGSHKRVRLERAERIYDRAVAKGDLKHSLLAVEHQRKEIEEKKENNAFFVLAQQYNFMSDEEIEVRKTMLMNKLKNKEVPNGNGGVQGETRG